MAAQGKETGFRSPHITGLFGEALPRGIRQRFDLLVSHMVSHGAVDHRQAVDVADRHRHRAVKGVLRLPHEQPEALPVLEACQKIDLQRRAREDKEQSRPLPPFVFQTADIS